MAEATFDEATRAALRRRAGSVENAGRFAAFIGVLIVLVAIVLAIVTLTEMNDDPGFFDEGPEYTTVDKVIAVSTVGLGVGASGVLLVAVGVGLLGLADYLAARAGGTAAEQAQSTAAQGDTPY